LISPGEKIFKRDSRTQYKKARKILITTIESAKSVRLSNISFNFLFKFFIGGVFPVSRAKIGVKTGSFSRSLSDFKLFNV
jgi:hypothetical protein